MSGASAAGVPGSAHLSSPARWTQEVAQAYVDSTVVLVRELKAALALLDGYRGKGDK